MSYAMALFQVRMFKQLDRSSSRVFKKPATTLVPFFRKAVLAWDTKREDARHEIPLLPRHENTHDDVSTLTVAY